MATELAMMRRAAATALKGIRIGLAGGVIRDGDRRAVEIYLLVTACGVSQPLAASVCGCTKQNVSKLLRMVEDRRDNADFDAAVRRIEDAITGGMR